MDELERKCLNFAIDLIDKGYPVGNVTVDELESTLHKLEIEKIEKQRVSDATIDYNDEIVSIEPVGDKETIDISVSGDNLFYCRGILTKNSFGLPATADFMAAIYTNEELTALNQYMFKQLKNRYNDVNWNKFFVVGVDRSKMRLYNVEECAQDDIDQLNSNQPVFDNTGYGAREEEDSSMGWVTKKAGRKDFSGLRTS